MQTPAGVIPSEPGDGGRALAHLFIAAARKLGFPTRFVNGYLLLDETGSAAMHSWAESHVEALGWVGFDPTHGISPDRYYVRLAVGRDWHDAMPVWGLAPAQAGERVAIHIDVAQ